MRSVSLPARLIEKTVAYDIHKSVWRHAGPVVGEEMRMRLDEGYDIVVLTLRRLEAAHTISRHYELVAADPAPVAAQTDIRRITQTVPAVEMIAGILQDLLYRNPRLEIFICEFW